MNTSEARSKALFIAAQLTAGIAQHVPEAFEAAAKDSNIPLEEMAAIRAELEGYVTKHLRGQASYYKAIAERNMRKRKG